jgi:hypothetical protein
LEKETSFSSKTENRQQEEEKEIRKIQLLADKRIHALSLFKK